MGIPREVPGLSAQAINFIKHKAYALIDTVGFTYSDRDDLEHELLLDLLQRLPRFNPERAQFMTFVVRVVDNKIASIIEDRTRPLYDFRLHAYSLNERMRGPDGCIMERGDEIDLDDYLQRTGWQSRPLHELLNLRADVERILPSLPLDLRDLCVRLQSQNIKSISIETGVPRYRLYAAVKRLRVLFEQAGLGVYVGSSKPSDPTGERPVQSSPSRKRGQL